MTNETKTITVLGATGSIGRQTLDVAERLGIGVRAIAAGRNVNAMEEAARRFHPAFAAMQDEAAAVYMKAELIDYAVSLIGATRAHPLILRGASPRATLSVTAMAKSVAYVQGRDYVVPKDVQTVFVSTVAHRLLMSPEAEAKAITPETVLEEILKRTPAPRV